MEPRHIGESLDEIERELEEAKRRHPAMAMRLETPPPWLPNEDGFGWTRVHPQVIYFERYGKAG
jgi:hypothetical protein